jgi:hypothetical protein
VIDCEASPSHDRRKLTGEKSPVGRGGKNRPRSKRAEYQARYRRRKLSGLASYLIDDLPEVELEETLRAARLLNVSEPTHEQTRLALKQLVKNIIKDHLAHCVNGNVAPFTDVPC